jgi:formylglycine-generating enzyme required for sulfatase activity
VTDAGAPGREPKVGGPIDPAEDLYIRRGADAEFIELLKAGEFVNLITSRQMGKTSLVYRAMAELGRQGYRFAYFDLSPLKHEPDAQRFFRTLVDELARGLELDSAAFGFRDGEKTGSQVFVDFFRHALATLPGPIVVVLDEIDSTLESAELSYTDDLFTAIRSIYTGRPREPVFKRLVFCLVGVATPNELIKARRTTPYNVGRTLWLTDFDPERDDLEPLARALSPDPAKAAALVERVLHWTGGQPYLTMLMCDELRRDGSLDPAAADALVERKFGSLDDLRGETHFDQIQRFVSERAGSGAEVLDLYARVLRGEREIDRPAHLACAHLKLSGLVKRNAHGVLAVRNAIYARLFDLEWVTRSRPARALRRARRLTYTAVTLLVLTVAGGLVYYTRAVAPLRTQAQARAELERMGVTLAKGGFSGWTDVGLPSSEVSRDIGGILRQAVPELQALGGGDPSEGLSLDLSSTPISDLMPLATLTSLRRLDLSNTNVTDVTPLADLDGLRQLSLSDTPMTDLESVGRLTGLERLDVSAARISDLGPLAALTALRRLDVSANRGVSDARPLGRLDRLEELNLSWTAITDLKTLEGLVNLRTLAIDGLGISTFQADGRIPGLRVLGLAVDGQPKWPYKAGQGFRDCEECPEMVVIPPGRFVMGSPDSETEGPQQDVGIGRPLAVGRYEVRFDEWAICVRERACRPVPDEGWGRGMRPVVNVSWDDARAYASWLSKKAGQEYRLLSEAEWEYTARAGTTTARFWGDDAADACRYANVADLQLKTVFPNFPVHDCDDGHIVTSPVGQFEPNPFGLLDTIGNVWEWVQDCWHESYEGAPADGRAWESGDCGRRVLRGGSWNLVPGIARAADRDGLVPTIRGNNVGFRLARTLSPPES